MRHRAWRRRAPPAPAPVPTAASPPAPLAAERATPPPAPQLAAPAIQLAKRVEIRRTRNLAPGALEGTVLDAETNAGIGAVLEARPEWLAVVDVVPGGGATDAGLVSGDQILAIDGTPVARLG